MEHFDPANTMHCFIQVMMMRMLVMEMMMISKMMTRIKNLFRAPSDCLQYFTGKTGTVYSYNYAGAQVCVSELIFGATAATGGRVNFFVSCVNF